MRFVLALVPLFVLLACTDTHFVEETEPHATFVHPVCGQVDGAQGIDVSHHQGIIDWPAVADDGVDFVFMKASEATDFRDRRFRDNWPQARSAGIVRGAYHFFRPRVSGVAQAEWFMRVLNEAGGLQPDDLPPVVDVEVDDEVPTAQLLSRLRDWLTHVEAATGKRPIIYTGSYFWDDRQFGDDFVQYPLWTAHYTANGLADCPLVPDPWVRWQLWQYTNAGRAAGIGGNVDRNVFNGTLAELRAWAGAGAECASRCGNGQCMVDRAPGYGELFMTPAGPEVYLAQHQYRHHVADEACFNLVFAPLSLADVPCVSPRHGALSDAPQMCRDGAWFKTPDDPRVYRLEHGRAVPLCGDWTGALFSEQADGLRLVDAVVEMPARVLDTWPVHRFDPDWPPRQGPPTCAGAGMECGRIEDPSQMCHRPIVCGPDARVEPCGACGERTTACVDGRWAAAGACVDECPEICARGEWSREGAVCRHCAPDGSGFDRARVIDDGNPCTIDRCDAEDGAAHMALPEGTACDDGNPMTRADRCEDGACVGAAAECDPGEWATSQGLCRQCGADGRWGDGIALDDGNPCTHDRCDSHAGPGHIALGEGEACDDGLAATWDDVCLDGACIGVAAECQAGEYVSAGGVCRGCVNGQLDAGRVIDDDNPCTDDICDLRLGVRHMPTDHAECSDGDPATRDDRCMAGRCVGGSVCDAGTWAPRDGGCARCDADGSGWGAPAALDAPMCRTLRCDRQRGVVEGFAADGTQCDDRRADTGPDACRGGVCIGVEQACVPGRHGWVNDLCRPCAANGQWGAGQGIDDDNPCTADRCDAVGGVTHAPIDGVQCTDHDDETINDVCRAGVCTGTAPVCALGDWRSRAGRCEPCAADGSGWLAGGVIDDGDTCTIDRCDPSDGITHAAAADGTLCGNERICRAGVCGAAVCEGPDRRACGDCGRATRQCVRGEWTAWGPCQGEGVCRAGDVRACDGGEQTCGAQCLWQACERECAASACGVRLGADGRSVEVDSRAFSLHDGTPLSVVLAQGDVCHIGWARGELFNHRQRGVGDADGDGWIEIPLPQLREGIAPFLGCPDCASAALPYTFNLRRCHADLETEPHYMNAGPPGGPLTGDFYWHGVNDVCALTGGLAVSWVNGEYVASGLDAGALSCE